MALIEEQEITTEPSVAALTSVPEEIEMRQVEKAGDFWQEMSPRVAFLFGLTIAIAALSMVALVFVLNK